MFFSVLKIFNAATLFHETSWQFLVFHTLGHAAESRGDLEQAKSSKKQEDQGFHSFFHFQFADYFVFSLASPDFQKFPLRLFPLKNANLCVSDYHIFINPHYEKDSRRLFTLSQIALAKFAEPFNCSLTSLAFRMNSLLF